MPPRASSRFTVYVVPGAPDQVAAHSLREELADASVVVGGEGEVIAERFERERFVANGQGGFRVRCPTSQESLVRPFAAALEAWRAGGARALRCPCGVEHDLTSLVFEPPAAFAQQWLRLVDASSLEVSSAAAAVLDGRWPGWRAIGSRG